MVDFTERGEIRHKEQVVERVCAWGIRTLEPLRPRGLED